MRATNVFTCSVISYSEVSSKDYKISSLEIKCTHLQCDIIEMKQVVFKSWFRNPTKRTGPRGKKLLKRTSFQVRDGPVKRTELRQGRENSRTLPYYRMMAAYPLATNTLDLHP